MKWLTILASALLLGLGEQQAMAHDPCICLIRAYDINPDSEMTIYYAEYNEEDCDNPVGVFMEDAPDFEEQECCHECFAAYSNVPTPAAAKPTEAKSAKQAQSQRLVALKEFASPKEKKKKDFKPKENGFTATPYGVARFYIQGDNKPCYARLFIIKHEDDKKTEKKESEGLTAVGFEIEPVDEGEITFDLDLGESNANVKWLKLNHPEKGTTIVPQQYRVNVGIEFLVLATR